METMRYTIQCVNMFFDILYSNGIFLPANDALQAQEYAMRGCVPVLVQFCFKLLKFNELGFAMAHGTGQKLFKLRPKLHMLYEIALQLHPHGPYVLPQQRHAAGLTRIIQEECLKLFALAMVLVNPQGLCGKLQGCTGCNSPAMQPKSIQLQRDDEKELHQELHDSVSHSWDQLGVLWPLGNGGKR